MYTRVLSYAHSEYNIETCNENLIWNYQFISAALLWQIQDGSRNGHLAAHYVSYTDMSFYCQYIKGHVL